MMSKQSLLTDILKQQLQHSEKNLINLENASDIDSSAESEDTEKVDLPSDDEIMTKDVNKLSLINEMNKQLINRPS